MSTANIIGSNSSLAEVAACYDDNASYIEDQSPTKARRFITACNILIRRVPGFSEQGAMNQRLSFDIEELSKQVAEARRWLATEGYRYEGGSTRYADNSRMRRWGR